MLTAAGFGTPYPPATNLVSIQIFVDDNVIRFTVIRVQIFGIKVNKSKFYSGRN